MVPTIYFCVGALNFNFNFSTSVQHICKHAFFVIFLKSWWLVGDVVLAFCFAQRHHLVQKV